MGIINDGHPTKVSFSGSASGVTVFMKEKEVTPPGMSMGGENDTTTMHNTLWRTKAPKQLKTLTPASFSAAYDPGIYTELVDLLGVNQLITVTFANASTLDFWGWIDEFTPGNVVEGEQPVADFTVIPSNQNGSGVEVAPSYSS